MSRRRIDEIIDPECANLFQREVDGERGVEEELREVPIFGLLSRKERQMLARIVHLRRYAAGETVIHWGVPQSGFYLIRSGKVEIVRLDLDGNGEVVDSLGPGELIGEFALLDDTPRSSSIVAAEPSELIGFFKPDLMGILSTTPAMGCKILLRLAEEMGRSLKRDYEKLRRSGYPFPEEREQTLETDLIPTS